MNETEQSKRTTLPLAVAAVRLGISPDALRMRIRRGKEKGFKRDGRLFVTLSEQPNEPVRSTAGASEHSGEQAHPERSGPGAQSPGPQADGPYRHSTHPVGGTAGAGPGSLPEQSLPVIVEFQKVELSRLLRDNTRLNRRLDQLMDELRHLREMQQREQVLRQQDQALRQQIQGTLDRLAERLPPPGRSDARDAAASDAAYAYTASEGPGAGTDQSPTDRSPTDQSPTDRSPADRSPADQVPKATHTGAAELAEILRDVGESLRALEATSAPAPDALVMPPAQPDEPRRPDTAKPAAGPAPRADQNSLRIPAAIHEQPADDEPHLLEILTRMGPSTEDRRAAARLMKRLLRSRGTNRSRDPDS